MRISMAVNVGDQAPKFELVDGDLKFRSLDEFKGKKVVLSFFVAASSPVCEVELCKFRDSLNDIAELGAQVIAISNDGPFANKAFGDYTSQTIKDYDILLKDLLHVKDYNAAKRSVFILDEEHKVIWKWVSEDPLKEPDYNEIMNVLK
jgi:peroxiredoxin